jgi:hypothetical protein
VQRLPQRHAERELIARRSAATARELLGRRIGRRAHHALAVGQHQLARAPGECRRLRHAQGPHRRPGSSERLRCARELIARRLAGRGHLRRARQPEVHHPHAAVVPDHHVVGLEVAVHEVPRVCGREAPAGLHEHVERLGPRVPALPDPRRERVPFDELHRHEHLAGVLAHVVHDHHVRVGEPGQRLRLGQQPPVALRHPLRPAARAQQLERHLAVELGVVRRVHHPHRARAQLAEHHVAAHGRPPWQHRVVPHARLLGAVEGAGDRVVRDRARARARGNPRAERPRGELERFGKIDALGRHRLPEHTTTCAPPTCRGLRSGRSVVFPVGTAAGGGPRATSRCPRPEGYEQSARACDHSRRAAVNPGTSPSRIRAGGGSRSTSR